MSITCKSLDHIYGYNTPFEYYALKNVNLKIEKGSFTAIIGQTGSGKSTLIQHINALLLPTSGEIKIDDYIISQNNKPQNLKSLRKKSGLVFQFPEYQLFEETIERDIMFGPMNFGIDENRAKEIAKKSLEMVGLDQTYLEKSPFDLSGGQKRRVAIAGILAMDPDILVLDEPTAGLDPSGIKEMMDLFKKIHEMGKTVVLVTHDMNHVLEYCDNVVVMNDGQVEKAGKVKDIFLDSDYLLNLGFTTLVDNYTSQDGKTYTDISLPLALGGLTKGVTNLELTNGFATIANQGLYHPAFFYTKIVDHDGNVLLDNTTNTDTKQVMKESTAWLLTSAMEDVILKGTGSRLKFKKINMPQAGKTGTSTGNRDLWFVGYTPYLTAGIWGGYDSGQKQTSLTYQKDLWRDTMEKLNQNYTKVSFKKPDSITTAVICTKCGKLAINGICDKAVGGSCIKKEYFDKESVPKEKCDCHVRCKICKASGHLAGDGCPSSQIYTAVYLQKNESTRTADSSLSIPRYLVGSTCKIHN